MNIEVTKDEVIIDKNSDKPHENEYNITQCYFTFDDFIESFQVKRAIFTIVSTGEMYETDIINHTCETPIEVLKHEYETIKLGVYGYNIGEKDELVNRFSPSYDTFVVPTGSYQEGALSPEPITPSQYDLYSQSLQEGLQEIDEAIENAERLNVDANKVGKITSITITKQDGTTKTVTLEDGQDGISLEDIEIDNRDLKVTYGGETENLGQIVPNIQIGTTTTGTPSTKASTVEQLKTWLSTHNTDVYYILATPITTEITDTTLINQLESIKLSYNEQTNISQENDNLPFELDVVALGELN